jgi:hypothetical protein
MHAPLPPVVELHVPVVMTENLQRVSVTLHLTSSHARLASPPCMCVLQSDTGMQVC